MKWVHYYQTGHIGHHVCNCTQSHDMTPKKVQNHDLGRGPLIQGRWEGTFTRGGAREDHVMFMSLKSTMTKTWVVGFSNFQGRWEETVRRGGPLASLGWSPPVNRPAS